MESGRAFRRGGVRVAGKTSSRRASIRGADARAGDAMQIDGGGGSGDADERFSDDDDDDDDDDDEAEHRAARRRHAAKHSSRTDGRSYPPLRREVTRQLATLCSADAYNALVAAALPERRVAVGDLSGSRLWQLGRRPGLWLHRRDRASLRLRRRGWPARGSTGDPLGPARAAEIGLRTVSEFVVAASSRLRASDRGDVMRSLAFGGFVNAAWTVLGRMQARRARPVVGGGAIRGERPGFEVPGKRSARPDR